MFEEQYEKWLADQRKDLTGEALRRFKEGHKHNEKLFALSIWWPAIGNFNFLHAEYEVNNSRNGSYFLDFAYIRPPHRIEWEIDVFSSHAKMITRNGFDYERDRQK